MRQNGVYYAQRQQNLELYVHTTVAREKIVQRKTRNNATYFTYTT